MRDLSWEIKEPELSKSYAIILSELTFNDPNIIMDFLRNLGRKKRMSPEFILILGSQRSISSRNNSRLLNETPFPLVRAVEGSPIFSLFCAYSSVERKFLWSTKYKIRYPCSENKEVVKIAYNSFMPYFDRDMDKKSIEGIVLKTFIEQKGISAEFMDAKYNWGSLDPKTGKFGGLTGMVSLMRCGTLFETILMF